MTNIGNPYQGSAKKVLCVCSAGLLRSPTLANILHKELGYNTRSCGTASNFALIPITEALIYWADEIVFVDEDCKSYLSEEAIEELKFSSVDSCTLNVPDNYDYGNEELEKLLLSSYLMT